MTNNTNTNNTNNANAMENNKHFNSELRNTFEDCIRRQNYLDHFKTKEDFAKAYIGFHIMLGIRDKMEFDEIYSIVMDTFPDYVKNGTEFLLLFNWDEPIISEDECIKYFYDLYEKMFNGKFKWQRFNYKQFWTDMGMEFMANKKLTKYNLIMWTKIAADLFVSNLGYIPNSVKKKMKKSVLNGEIIDRTELLKHKYNCGMIIDRFLILNFNEEEIREYFMKIIVGALNKEDLNYSELTYKLFGKRTYYMTTMPYTDDIYSDCIREIECTMGLK